MDPKSAPGTTPECLPLCPTMISCPTGLKVLHCNGMDSLLLGWDVPERGNFVVGYEVSS